MHRCTGFLKLSSAIGADSCVAIVFAYGDDIVHHFGVVALVEDYSTPNVHVAVDANPDAVMDSKFAMVTTSVPVLHP